MAAKKKKVEKAVQPEINIGLVGHVDHGKTTLVKALSGKWADTHSEEMVRGITIRLGYADVNIYECGCKGTEKLKITDKCLSCKKKGKLLRKVSLVDAPGHESLMATMLCGANIMDGALLLVSASEECPQPQTQEHLMALEIIGMEKVIIVQNKIDLVSEEQAKKNYEQIKKFLKGTKYEKSPIIPMSALHNINLDVLLETIQKVFTTPERDETKDPIMYIARSFDINKPGSPPKKLVGGVLGGALNQGKLVLNSEIEIRPGYQDGKKWKPLTTKIISLMTGGTQTDAIIPGGSIAVMTELDPSVVKSDQLVGHVAGLPEHLPPVWTDLTIEPHLLERVVGAKDKLVVEPLKKGEVLMLNVNSAATVGVVQELGKKAVKLALRRPVCADTGSRVTVSRMVGQRWRLIGYGIIKK